jgi:hypothetical protein
LRIYIIIQEKNGSFPIVQSLSFTFLYKNGEVHGQMRCQQTTYVGGFTFFYKVLSKLKNKFRLNKN